MPKSRNKALKKRVADLEKENQLYRKALNIKIGLCYTMPAFNLICKAFPNEMDLIMEAEKAS